MRYLLLSVLVVCIIGLIIPNAFAADTEACSSGLVWDGEKCISGYVQAWHESGIKEAMEQQQSKTPSSTSDLYSEEELGNIRLQEKLDEYWNCIDLDFTKFTPDCIATSLPSYNEMRDLGYIFDVETMTQISNYGVYCDPVCQLKQIYDDEGNSITHYPVENKLKKFQNKNLHQQLFDTYVSITPPQILDEVRAFYIETDDFDGIGAEVERLSWLEHPYNKKFWIGIDPADMVYDGVVDEQYLKPTLIHENAHILSLSANQGDNNRLPPEAYDRPSLFKQLMTKGERSCENYYNDVAGCMEEDSILNEFFQKFWAGRIYDDHKWEFEFSDDGFDSHNADFYWKLGQEHWNTRYSSESPDEDFAESFMAFVLKEYPEQKLKPPTTVMKNYCTERTISGSYCLNEHGQRVHCTKTIEKCTERAVTLATGQKWLPFSIADQKIIFFYDYPELVEMRDFIRSAMATSEFCNEGSVWKDGKCQQTGGCLIATAAFGSEMSPQVQMLREIRDNTVLQTESGSAFMTGFNQFYYSFSPTIADYERENPAFKETVKLALTPLLTSLTLLQYADINSESEMLGYGIGVILLNIGMYFVAPAVLLSVCIRKISKN